MSLFMDQNIKVSKRYWWILMFMTIINASCNNSSNIKENIKYFYVESSGASIVRKIDTVEVKSFSLHSKNDSLFLSYKFVLNGFEHELRKYSNIHKYNMDGSHFSYELDNYGIIFSSSFTFQNQRRLISSNDSINRIINYSLGEALFNTEYQYSQIYNCNRHKKIVDFSKN